MQAGLNKRELHRLAHAFILLKNDRMCLDFLEDICTPNELKALSQRLEVAVRRRSPMLPGKSVARVKTLERR